MNKTKLLNNKMNQLKSEEKSMNTTSKKNQMRK